MELLPYPSPRRSAICASHEDRLKRKETAFARTISSIALGSYDQRKSTPSISLGSSAIME